MTTPEVVALLLLPVVVEDVVVGATLGLRMTTLFEAVEDEAVVVAATPL